MEQSQLSKGSFGFLEAVCDGATGGGGSAGGFDAGGGALAATPAFARLVGALGGGVSEDLAGIVATALVAGGAEDGIAMEPALAGGLDEHATSITRAPGTSAPKRQ